MTQYTYDCLTRKYTSVTLGTASETLEGTTIAARQLASGSITGTKLALNCIGSGHLQSGSVGSLHVKAAAIQSAHIQTAAITQAHIANALIETLNANAITAVSAKIQELAAGQITTDELYAAIAMIPKYYAQNSHPAIVSAEVFDLTQMELEWRRSLKGSYSGKNCFASRIVCGDCGAFYGSKVWHSTDEYRRTIWRCNNKYEGDKRCSTPHVTQDELEKAFVSVMQKVIAEKDAIFTVCRDVLDEVLNTTELDRIATRLQDQALGMAERVRKLVEENARVRRDQEEYQKEYDALAAEHEKLSEKIRSIEEQKKDKTDRRRRIEVFLRMLEEQEECVEFDPYTFAALVDKIVVGQDRKLEINFRNGMEYEYTTVG